MKHLPLEFDVFHHKIAAMLTRCGTFVFYNQDNLYFELNSLLIAPFVFLYNEIDVATQCFYGIYQ